MTIKDVEERTGLSRSNVRFYEKEKLVEPSRNESNGYRDYSENDVENIKKIAYLRTLGISIEDIRSIISGKVTLQETLEKQNEVLKSQITDLNKAKRTRATACPSWKTRWAGTARRRTRSSMSKR